MKNIALAVLFAANLVSVTASAAPIDVTVTSMEYATPTSVHIHAAPVLPDLYVYSGAFSTIASDRTGSFATWCIDIFQETHLGQTVRDYTRLDGVAALGSQKTGLMERLATESLGLVNDATTSSAFQLAVWELINENTGTFDLTAGSFTASGASDLSMELAASWLRGLPGANVPARYTLSVLKSESMQDLADFTRVPEPSTLAVLAAGLLGFAVSRRKFRRVL